MHLLFAASKMKNKFLKDTDKELRIGEYFSYQYEYKYHFMLSSIISYLWSPPISSPLL